MISLHKDLPWKMLRGITKEYQGMYIHRICRRMCMDGLDVFPRDIAMEILMHQPEGSFMVRNSSSSPGSYALTMKGPQSKTLHYLIQPVPNGFKLQVRPVVTQGVSYTIRLDQMPFCSRLFVAASSEPHLVYVAGTSKRPFLRSLPP